MTSVNLKEQKKLMAEARARHATSQSTLKSDPFGLLVRTTRSRCYESLLLTSPPLKKQKTTTIDPVKSVDQIVSALMREPGQGSCQNRSYSQFKFWDKDFDGFKFLYTHMGMWLRL